MKFESFTPKEPKKENEQEKTPKPSLRDKLKRWAVYASVLGATFMSGKLAHDVSEFNDAYRTYAENVERDTKADSLLSEIENRFGEDGTIISQFIRDGDNSAFVERHSEKEKITKFKGFNQMGIDDEVIEVIFKSGDFFPKKWIDGEVDKVEYVDESIYAGVNDKGSERYLGREKIGEHSNSGDDTSIYFYKNSEFDAAGLDTARKILSLRYHMIHETAHANDWETDKNMNLAERASLLLSVLERIKSEDAFESYNKKQRGGNYWEGFMDGTSFGLHNAAQEYWAEICQAYFLEPESMKEKYPKDFELVDQIIRKDDSDFDPVKNAGPYFDGKTGDLLPEWREFLESL